MNPYLETLKEELREELGEGICQADWDCFWDGLRLVDRQLEVMWCGYPILSTYVSDDEMASDAASYAQGTRADLPSIVKYAYAAIEENLK